MCYLCGKAWAAVWPSICHLPKGQSAQSAHRHTDQLILIYSANQEADGRINYPLSSSQGTIDVGRYYSANTNTYRGVNDVQQEAEVNVFPNTHTFLCVCVCCSVLSAGTNVSARTHTHTQINAHFRRCCGSEFSQVWPLTFHQLWLPQQITTYLTENNVMWLPEWVCVKLFPINTDWIKLLIFRTEFPAEFYNEGTLCSDAVYLIRSLQDFCFCFTDFRKFKLVQHVKTHD